MSRRRSDPPTTAGRRRAAAGLALLLGLGLVPAVVPAQAPQVSQTMAGVSFEPRIQLAGQPLLLNGTGVRAVAWFKGYAAALYLAQRAGTAEAVVAQAGPKRLQMRMLVEVPVDELTKAVHKGVQRNQTAAAQQALAERVARFDAQVSAVGKVRKGDTINLDFVPGQGTLVLVNGRALGPAIAGEDFYGALLKVFIGERVSDEALRAGLLGRPVAS